MSVRVFISHASEDLALAGELHRWLVDDGHEVFLDQHPRDGITVGEEWEQPGVLHPLLKAIQHTELLPDRVAACAALAEALRRVDAAGNPGWPDGISPFPGLLPFDVDRHRVFFGRAGEVEQLAELLRSAAERTEDAALLVHCCVGGLR